MRGLPKGDAKTQPNSMQEARFTFNELTLDDENPRLPEKLVHASQQLAAQHYAVHKERPLYPSLVKFITSGPTVAVVLGWTKRDPAWQPYLGLSTPWGSNGLDGLGDLDVQTA